MAGALRNLQPTMEPVGRTITVRLEGLGRVRARIVAVPDESTVVLQPQGGAPRPVPLAAIRDARLAVDW